MHHTHRQNLHYRHMDVHQVHIGWTEAATKKQIVDELICKLYSVEQRLIRGVICAIHIHTLLPGNERFMNEICERELNELNAKI